MKTIITLGLAAIVAGLAAQAHAITNEDCMINYCLPGVNPCSDCCEAEWEAAGGGACWDGCWDAYDAAAAPCYTAYYNDVRDCWTSTCFNNAFNKRSNCLAPIEATLRSCQDGCDAIPIVGTDCPGAQAPQTCPYNCQVYNPPSRSCIGAAMNGCDW